MKERPILFSGPMVRAILEGRKTQTRRVMKDAPGQGRLSKPCVYGVPGDRLWVRETAIVTPKHWGDMRTFTHRDSEGDKRWVQYLATSPNVDAAKDYKLKVSPSIFMPRWASRITLEIADVRVQRLQEISEEDAKAEGARSADYASGRECILSPELGSYRLHFHSLWDSINAKRGFGWDSNPWVWAITFQKLGTA